MLKLDKVQDSIAKLSREDLGRFRKWFQKYDADAWIKNWRRMSRPENSITWRMKQFETFTRAGAMKCKTLFVG